MHCPVLYAVYAVNVYVYYDTYMKVNDDLDRDVINLIDTTRKLRRGSFFASLIGAVTGLITCNNQVQDKQANHLICR